MKKRLFVCLMIAFTFVLSGCKNPFSSSKNDDFYNSNYEQQEPENYIRDLAPMKF